MPKLVRINKRRRGYLTFAVGDSEQIRRAYLLALLIRSTQSEAPYLTVCVAQGYSVPNRYVWAFDNIVEIPYPDGRHWSPIDEWNSIHASPYEQTIKLDNDMLVASDLSTWWDVLSMRDFAIAMHPTRSGHAEFFANNSLPPIDPAMVFFNKSKRSFELFSFMRELGKSWMTITGECFVDPPKIPDVRSLLAATLRLMDMDRIYQASHAIPRVNDLRHLAMEESWMVDALNNATDDRTPIHYGRMNAPTDGMFQTIERMLRSEASRHV